MAIHVQIDPLERTATLRGVHSLCAGESSEVILSGVPDADTPTLSLRVYRDATEAVQVACSVRPGTDPAEEGLVPVEGRAALRRGVLDLRTSAVSEWAEEDAAAAAAAEEARRSGSKEPEARAAASYRRPDSAWLVVADSSRVWAACGVPFVLRPFDDALSPDPEVPLPSYAERAEAAARAAEEAAARAEEAAEDAESAEATGKVGRDELFDDPDSASPKVKASLLPSYVDDVLEVAELPASGESGKLYVVTGTNAVYRWTGSSFVEVSPSRDWSGELSGKRGLDDLAVDRDRWLLVKPDGTLVWMVGRGADPDTWDGDDELEPYLNRDTGPLGEAWIFEVGPQASGERARLEIPYSAVPIDSAVVVFDLEASTSFDGVYRLVRGSRLALDTEIPVVDEALTNSGNNPVKSSGIWGAIWGALASLPFGFESLYDWCKSFFVHASAIAPKWDAGGTYRVGDVCVESEVPDSSGLLYRCKKAYTATSESNAPSNDTEHWELVDVTTLIASKQDALSSTQLTNIAAVPGKADAADLRYRIAEAGYATTGARLPDNVAYVIADGTTYQASALTLDGTSTYMLFGNGNVLGVEWRRDTGTLIGNPFNVVFYDSSDTPFSAVPNLLVPRALADRTVNFITATDETSLDIELPAAVTVDAVRYARDFFLDIDNSVNASDLALEFTALGVSYAFVPLEDDSVGEMVSIGAGERVRLYFTETPYHATGSLPVINVARVTLGDFVTSTTTQGGN